MWEFLSRFTPDDPTWKDIARFSSYFVLVVFGSVAVIYGAGLFLVK